ncbi:retrovirus-related pol polyprotein from transposon TNT 1-94 [Tanacetum coccineum]
MNSFIDNASMNVHECEKCQTLETELFNKKDFVEKEIYDKLFKSFTTLEKHCISLEVDTQLNQEIFQRDNSISNQSAPSFDQMFELNELKAQSQEKDTVIKKLKERIQSLTGKMNEDKINKDLEKIETINIELDHRVSKLIAKNEYLKQTYKQLYDLIKLARIRSKEQCDDLINQVNLKSVEISNLNATHSAYTKHTQEEATVLRDLVEQVKSKYPLDHSLKSAYRYAKLIQELLTNISKTCPNINKSDRKLVVVTPKNKDKRVRFTESVTSSGNTITKIASTSNLVSNKPMLSSTGVKSSTSASGSQPSGNTKKDKIQQTPSNNQKNKVEAHPRKGKSSLKNKDCVIAPKGTANVPHPKLNAKSKLKCVKCNGCMLSDNHDLCVPDFINNVNAHVKSKSVKKSSKRKVWKPIGKMFTKIGYIWRPTGQTLPIVGNACPLTRITTPTEMPLRKPTALLEMKHLNQSFLSCRPKFVLSGIMDSAAQHMNGDRSQLTNVIRNVYDIKGLLRGKTWTQLILGWAICDSNLEVAFRQHTCFIRNLEGVDLLTGSRGNNLYTLSLGDMMASSPICLLSKASKTKSWIWHRRLSHLNFGAINHLARHDLVKKRSSDFIINSQDDLKLPALKCLSEESEQINGTEFVNQTLREYYEKVDISHETYVARSPQQNGMQLLPHVIPNLKFKKDHLCSTCAMGKSKKKPHKPKSEDTNKEKLYLLHMDLYGLMRVASVNGKKYILVIIDDYSRFTWVKCLKSKDEPPDFIINVDHPSPELIAPIAEVVALEPAASTSSPSSTTVDQDAPSPNVEHMNNNLFFGISIPKNDSEASSSSDVIPTVVHTATPNSEHVTKYTKDHPLENIIDKLERPVSTRLQLHEQALFCYYDAFLTSVEPKNYKDALTQACWIEAMQEELHEFERLEV